MHAAGVHSLIKVWNWLAIAPPALCTLLAAYLYGVGAPDGLKHWDQAILWLGVVLIIGNTIEVVIRHADTAMYRAKEAGRNSIRFFLPSMQVAAEERLRQLEYLARHDQLTGLLNRRAFDEALSDAMLIGADRPVAVVMIDLDGFKPVNDRHGHAAGDAILVELAARLRSAVAVGHIARLGGDEFGIVIDGSDRDAVMEVAHHVRDACCEPLEFEDAAVSVGASVGVAISRPGDTMKTLCARADKAMYAAKSGRLPRPLFAAGGLARTG